MLYKMHYNLVEIDHQKYLEPAGRCSRHMHKFLYKVPASKTNYHLFSFFPNTIRDWNSLPLNVVEAQSVNSLRAKLDMFGLFVFYCYYFLILSVRRLTSC